jgi:hypothetical protein
MEWLKVKALSSSPSTTKKKKKKKKFLYSAKRFFKSVREVKIVSGKQRLTKIFTSRHVPQEILKAYRCGGTPL